MAAALDSSPSVFGREGSTPSLGIRVETWQRLVRDYSVCC